MVNDFPDLAGWFCSTRRGSERRSGSHLGLLVDMVREGQVFLARTGVRFEGSGGGRVGLQAGGERAESLLLHQQPGVQVIVLLWRAAQPLLQVQPGQSVLLVLPVVGGVPGVAVLYEVAGAHPAVHGLGGVQQSHACQGGSRRGIHLLGLYES